MSYIIPEIQNELLHCIDNESCIACSGEATEFRQPIDAREYLMSGLCQKCQDEVFGLPTEVKKALDCF